MRWLVLFASLSFGGCDKLIGIEDPHGLGGDGGGLTDGSGGDGSMPGDGSPGDGSGMPCTSATPAFASPTSNSVTGAVGFAVADLDKNGTQDIAVAVQTDIGLLFNDGTGKFPGALRKIRAGENVAADDVLIADLDGDGRPDVVSWSGGTLSVNFHDTTVAGFLAAVSAPTTITVQSAIAGQLDGAGGLDLAITDGLTTHVLVVPDQATVNDIATLNGGAIAVADVDGDGKQDIILLDQGQKLAVAFGSGTGAFMVKNVGLGGVKAAIGKFSTDALASLVVDGGSGDMHLIRQTAARTFATAEDFVFQHLTPDATYRPHQVVDVNGDGRDDIVGNGQLVTQCGPPAPAGGVSQPTDMALPVGIPNPIETRLVDLNKDGHPDVVQIDQQNSGVFVSIHQ